MTVALKNKNPQLLQKLECWGYVYLQVLTAGSIRLAQRQEELDHATFGVDGGIQVSNTDGLKIMPWRGAMWGLPTVDDLKVEVTAVT